MQEADSKWICLEKRFILFIEFRSRLNQPEIFILFLFWEDEEDRDQILLNIPFLKEENPPK